MQLRRRRSDGDELPDRAPPGFEQQHLLPPNGEPLHDGSRDGHGDGEHVRFRAHGHSPRSVQPFRRCKRHPVRAFCGQRGRPGPRRSPRNVQLHVRGSDSPTEPHGRRQFQRRALCRNRGVQPKRHRQRCPERGAAHQRTHLCFNGSRFAFRPHLAVKPAAALDLPVPGPVQRHRNVHQRRPDPRRLRKVHCRRQDSDRQFPDCAAADTEPLHVPRRQRARRRVVPQRRHQGLPAQSRR